MKIRAATINPSASVINNNLDSLNNLPAVLEKARIDGSIPGMSVTIIHKGAFAFIVRFKGSANTIRENKVRSHYHLIFAAPSDIVSWNPGYSSKLSFFLHNNVVMAHLTNIDITGLLSFIPYYIADGILILHKTNDCQTAAINTAINPTQMMYDVLTKAESGNLPPRIEGASQSRVDRLYQRLHTPGV